MTDSKVLTDLSVERMKTVYFSYKGYVHWSQRYAFGMSKRLASVGFTVEPFVEGHPGEHVTAAIEAATAAGLQVDMGPFSNVAFGDVALIAKSLEQIVVAAFDAGATRISIQVGAT